MIHGVINIYKEKGYTSHDVVAKLRGIVGQKKIGHTGTLDPDAVGVLPVCLGKATKLCDMLTDKDKTYETVLRLGITTDTQDSSGRVLEEKEIDGITKEVVEACIESFIGDYMQIPPMYSALKVNGKMLYELAREGKEIERQARGVTIYDIQITDISLPYVSMTVSCSKGTYIRTLCHDIGGKLGCGGCMDALKRTRVSRFDISQSVTLGKVEELVKAGRLSEILIPIDEMFASYEKVTVKKEFASLVYNGNFFLPKHILEQRTRSHKTPVRVYDEAGVFLAIYEFDGRRNLFGIQKMFYSKDEK